MTAFIYCELERVDDSRSYYEPLAATGFTDIRFDNLWLVGIAACAEVCARLGDSASAAVLADLMSPYSDHVAVMATSGLNCVSHYLGILVSCLGRFEEAEARFSAAATTQRRMGAPSWLARTRLEWARMLLTRGQPGDAERARGLLGQALGTARELGLANVERRAVELLS